MAEVIHKLNIMPEAAFDLAYLSLAELNKRLLKAEVEEYISQIADSGKLSSAHYFRCDYLDEDSETRLKLFIYRGIKIGPMQYWDLKGVCKSIDWSEEAEDDGIIRLWLESKIEDLPNDEDWAVRTRVKNTIDKALVDIFDEIKKFYWEDVVLEVKNEFECFRDKETAERLALLQSIHFIQRGRGRAKKKNRRRRENG